MESTQSVAELTSLESRLRTLETQNRRLKRVGLALGAGCVLMSFAAPRLCNTVTAERIVLEDRHGHNRIVLDAYAGQDPSFTFHDRKGAPSARIAVDSEGNLDLSVFQAGKAQPMNLALDAGKVRLGSAAAQESKAKKADSGAEGSVD